MKKLFKAIRQNNLEAIKDILKKKIMIIINTNIILLKSIRKMVSLYLMGKVH